MEEKSKLIECQQSAIAKCLRPSEVIPILVSDGILCDSDVENILKYESQVSTEKAATMLLKQIIRENKPGWAASFERALVTCELSTITCLLEDFDSNEEMEMYSKFLNLFMEYLVDIIPSDLFPYLQQVKCLSYSDVDHLRKLGKNDSIELVVVTMLRMLSKRRDYAAHFLEALKRTESKMYGHIIENLEPQLEKNGFTTKEQFEKLAKEQLKVVPSHPVQNDELTTTGNLTRGRPVAAVRPSTSVSSVNSLPTMLHNSVDNLREPQEGSDFSAMDTDPPAEEIQMYFTELPETAVGTNLPSFLDKPCEPVSKKQRFEVYKGRPEETETASASSKPLPVNLRQQISKAVTLPTTSRETPEADTFNEIRPSESVTNPSDIIPEDALEEFNDVQPNDLKLFPFQEELAKPCIDGQNKVIVAPTNSGKTFVAMAIAQSHLQKQNVLIKRSMGQTSKTVVFLVPKVCLAIQQHRQFTTYLNQYKTWHITGSSMRDLDYKIPIKTMFKVFDILVMTPQILVENVKAGGVTFEDISLMIFDECHNAKGGNPMNALSKRYLIKKLDRTSEHLPQIVGLTASVGLGRSPSAIDDILKLCATLDSTIHIVTNEKESLRSHLKSKTKKVATVRSRNDNTFRHILLDLVACTEEKFKALTETISGLRSEDNEGPIELPEAGTLQYLQKMVALKKDVTEMKEKRRGYRAYLDYLQIYSQSLLLYQDANAKDALDLIYAELSALDRGEAAEVDEVEEWLAQEFTGREELLKINAEKDINPKLKRLKEELLQYLVDKDKARAMVLVRTIDLTISIERYLRNDPDMKEEHLTVGRLVGLNVPSSRKGMTQAEWDQTLDLFRRGRIRVLVCTNVAEEGLDIPDCSLVVKYDINQNEISKVQAEGRARADNAMIITLGSIETNNIAKEAILDVRVEIMHEAVEKIFNMRPQEVLRKLKCLQNDIVLEEKRRLLFESKRDESRVHPVGEYKLICIRCEKFVCQAADMRTYEEVHHVVLDPTFPQRFSLKKLKPRKAIVIGKLKKEFKICCKHCPQGWGIKATCDGKMVFLLSQGNFMIVRDNGERDNLMKWQELPFEFEKITHEDLIGISPSVTTDV